MRFENKDVDAQVVSRDRHLALGQVVSCLPDVVYGPDTGPMAA